MGVKNLYNEKENGRRCGLPIPSRRYEETIYVCVCLSDINKTVKLRKSYNLRKTINYTSYYFFTILPCSKPRSVSML